MDLTVLQSGGAGIFSLKPSITSVVLNEILLNPETKVEMITNSSLSGIVMILKIPSSVTKKYMLRTIDESTMKTSRPVTRLLIKLVLVSSDKSYIYKLERNDKRVDSEKEFIRENRIQQEVFRVSTLSGRPICPAVMYSAIISGYEPLLRKMSTTYTYPTARRLLRNLSVVNTRRGTKLGIIAMELATGYETAYTHYRNDIHLLMTRMYRQIHNQFQVLYKIGYIHNDEHMNNVMYNPETNYALIIDFGRVRRSDHRNYQTYWSNTRLESWLSMRHYHPLSITLNRNESMEDFLYRSKIAGLNTQFMLIEGTTQRFSYDELERFLKLHKYHLESLKKQAKSPAKVKKPAKAKSPAKGKKSAKAPAKTQKTKSMTKTKTRKSKNCKGVALSECERMSGCKVAKGAKRRYCRKTANKKKRN